MSDPTLLEILSLGSDPPSVVPHFQSGLFDSLTNVTFDKVDKTRMLEMFSQQGEKVCNNCSARFRLCSVPDWCIATQDSACTELYSQPHRQSHTWHQVLNAILLLLPALSVSCCQQVEFERPVDAKGNIEVWLQRLVDGMQDTVKQVSDCVQ